MLASVFADYFSAQVIEGGRRKIGLYLSLGVNLGLLCYFKYGNFAFENYYAFLDILGIQHDPFADYREIIQPLGISFYTFQTLSYTLDVYWGKVKANRNFIDFAAYVTFFPQLIAGPIIRYRDVYLQFQDSKRERFDKFALGVERFIIGLGKKVILGNSFARIADAAFSTPSDELTMGFAWYGIFAFAIQLFYDFSGYSDMAIGMGKMFGFDFKENFNYPGRSRTMQEYWTRWHISLGNWFRDYVYFPLRRTAWGRKNTPACILILFTGIGFWHGANWTFILFGLFQGLVILCERFAFSKKIKSPWPMLSYLYMTWLFLMSSLMFRSDSLSQIWEYGQVLYGFGQLGWDGAFLYLNKEMLVLNIVAFLLWMPTYMWVKSFFHRITKAESSLRSALEIAYWIGLLGLLLVSAAYLTANTYNPFIYFRF
jgi:alginate O-acetyltransferase complex protein AlgI